MAVFSKRNSNYVLCVYQVIETLVNVWENARKLSKYSPVGLFSNSISLSPKLPLVFLELDRNTVYVSYFLISKFFEINYFNNKH